ncbi:molybdopterin-containing oxidoreductase family protein [Symbiobacterium terraclitae]|uniref:molybdopterin-containing oxidoreductase family protein n=1 Tax=Symbiobacterium terraclitae TaxID=557451 RepID=UPI0035B5658C
MPKRETAGKVSRRDFLVATAAAVGGVTLLGRHRWARADLVTLKPFKVENPLAAYPERDWESLYRDQYRYDSEFTFLCVPNCTHNCRVKGVVRNGVMVRVEPPYTEGTATDLYGTMSSQSWHPRGCLKGYTLPRRIYGPYRTKYPMVRKGWKAWVEAGWPDQSRPEVKEQYFRRGWDDWVRVSWDEANTLVAKTLLHIMATYSGEEGVQRLREQGYPEEMIEAMGGSGAQTLKFRNGMALNGVIRINALARFANMLALYDGQKGARQWSSYDWHGDLNPGHPMSTGVKCSDVDMNDFRNTKLMIFLGKNQVENKMADAHWWIEIIERGGKVVNISPEYSPASQKSDYWLPVRPGSDIALLLGLAHILYRDGLIDFDFVRQHTDMPLLVRMDTLKRLTNKDLGIPTSRLTGYSVTVQKIDPALRESWGDFVIWDEAAGAPRVINREHVGAHLPYTPALEGTFTVRLADGSTVECKTIYQLYKEHVAEYTPEMVSEATGVPVELIERLAHDLGTIKPAHIATGEGVNHYFHCDLTGRAAFLLVSLTGNVGKPGANTTHWAGNYRGENHPGLPLWMAEDPFNPNLDPNARPEEIKVKKYYKSEHPAYWNYGDRPLIVNGRNYTGKTHMPTPTKAIWIANSNHLNNAKWAHHMIEVVNKNVEMFVVQDWEWTGSCEHADVVFPVQSWAEMTHPDMTSACSNPFFNVWKGGLKPLYESKQDVEVMAGVAGKLAELTGDQRYSDYWKFVNEGRTEVYLQRVSDGSYTTSGYDIQELLESDRDWLMMFRTYPRIFGWEQVHEHKPWYTKTGRIELYKDEDEFINLGENLIVHREPVEATPYLPNLILGTHPAIRPVNEVPLDAVSADERSIRNVKMSWAEAKQTRNPLWEQGYRFYFLTPKSRHRVHSSWAMTDWNVIWDSNFGDPYRNDPRTPSTGEAQIHINPEDAAELGINDGDYVYVDANPADRPYIGWKESDPYYEVARLKVRVRFNPAYPRGVTMMKHAIWIASPKTVQANKTRADGLAISDTGYMAHVRTGSHQSATRGWLQPSQMTDSLVRKAYMGQEIGVGYEVDVNAPNTCPKETLVKITKAEDGGPQGQGVWKPATSGFTPGNENETMLRYLQGGFVDAKGGS